MKQITQNMMRNVDSGNEKNDLAAQTLKEVEPAVNRLSGIKQL